MQQKVWIKDRGNSVCAFVGSKDKTLLMWWLLFCLYRVSQRYHERDKIHRNVEQLKFDISHFIRCRNIIQTKIRATDRNATEQVLPNRTEECNNIIIIISLLRYWHAYLSPLRVCLREKFLRTKGVSSTSGGSIAEVGSIVLSIRYSHGSLSVYSIVMWMMMIGYVCSQGSRGTSPPVKNQKSLCNWSIDEMIDAIFFLFMCWFPAKIIKGLPTTNYPLLQLY